jgi:hypothetical protein
MNCITENNSSTAVTYNHEDDPMSKPSFLMPAAGRTGGVARKSDTESRLAKASASPEHHEPVQVDHTAEGLQHGQGDGPALPAAINDDPSEV